VLILAAGTVTGDDWLRWAAVPIGLATGIACAVYLGCTAVRRLQRRRLIVLWRLTDHGRSPRPASA